MNATEAAAAAIGLPSTIQTAFAGTAQAYQDSLGSEPVLNLDVFAPFREDYRHLVEYQQFPAAQVSKG